jgi:hypothetical protein
MVTIRITSVFIDVIVFSGGLYFTLAVSCKQYGVTFEVWVVISWLASARDDAGEHYAGIDSEEDNLRYSTLKSIIFWRKW